MKSIWNTLISNFRSLKKKGSFIQNFSFVFGSKSITLLIGFLFTPVIARIYSPDAYGTFALYNAVVANLTILIGMQIPISFVVIDSEKKFLKALRLHLGFVLFGSLVVTLLFLFFDTWLFQFVENKALMGYGYLLGLGVVLRAIIEIISQWNIREGAFKQTSIISASETFSTKLSILGLGIKYAGPKLGLIFGELIGKSAYILLQFPLFVKDRFRLLIPVFSLKGWRWLFRTFKDYPLYLMTSTWISQFSNTAIILYLSFFFSADSVGYYSMATGLIAMPVILIAYASQPVMTQKVAALKKEGEEVHPQISRFINSIVLLGLIILVGGVTIGEQVISLFLGSTWDRTALFAVWMMPTIGMQFVFMPLSGVLIGLQQNQKLLLLNSLRTGVVIGGLIVIYFLNLSFDEIVKAIIIVQILSFLGAILLTFKFIEVKIGLAPKLVSITYLIISFFILIYY